MRYIVSLAFLGLCVGPAMAQSSDKPASEAYVCKNEIYIDGSQVEATRTVRVVYPDDGEHVCELLYGKPTEGQPETAQWWAEGEENINYCSNRADSFINRLAGFGWTCEADEERTAGVWSSEGLQAGE